MPTCSISPPKNSLVSFHYFGGFDLDRLPNLRLIGDSGAYSARVQNITISNDDLGNWAQKWQHRLAWVASMDIAGDTAKTRYNWEAIVKGYGIPAVSSLHMGTPPEEMDWYAEQGVDFLGLGGVAGGSASKDAVFRWLVSVFKYAQKNHPQMRFHGWGITSQSWIRLPFFSVDSSSWGSSYRYGQLILRDPRTFKRVTMGLNGRDVYNPRNAKLLSNHYGVAPSEVSLSKPDNRHKIVRLSALSAALQEKQMRRMHPTISHPKWGVLGGASGMPDGPHIHLAEGHHKHLEYVDELALTGDVSGPVLHDHLPDGPHMHLAEASIPNLVNLNQLAGGEEASATILENEGA